MKEELKARELSTREERGKTVEDWCADGLRIIIKSNNSHFTAYIGLSENHPLSGFDYDSVDFEVHGGLTFGKKGDGKYLPEGFYWYGWDYAHAGDFCYYTNEINNFDAHDWTLGEIIKDIKDSLWSITRLVKLAEKIKNN